MWFAILNDLVGGWSVSNYPFPLSEHDHRIDGDPAKRGYVVADCMNREDAEVIAAILNREGYRKSHV